MKISTKGRYGLRALIDIAQYSEIEPVSISSISARQDISERYLEQLMALLKKAGLIKSIRGAGGGYVPVECAAFHEEELCEAAGGCVTKYVWKKINESINRTVDEIDLKQLVEESKQVQQDLTVQKKCNN